MKINLPIKSSNKFLLGWFVVASALAHLLFISLAESDAVPQTVTVNFSAPLQITIISSRSTAKMQQKAAPQKKMPVKKMLPPVKKVAIQLKVVDNSDTKRITEVPANTLTRETELISVKNIPLNHLRQQIKQAIKAKFTYPRMARRMGWEGLVGISLHIEDDGSLNRVHIARSSGHKLLDDNAKRTIEQIGKIQVASNFLIQATDTEIEVLYRLTD